MKVLICVDMQNDFVTGALGSPEAKAIVPNVVKLIQDHSETMTLLLYTQDTHTENYMETVEGSYLPVPHCIEGTDGWELIPELKALDIEEYCYWDEPEKGIIMSCIKKPTFGSAKLIETLQSLVFDESETIDEFLFCGVCTDICVISNVLLVKAFFPEIPITVDASCCAGVTPEKHAAALEVMKSCHINVINEEV